MKEILERFLRGSYTHEEKRWEFFSIRMFLGRCSLRMLFFWFLMSE